MSVQLASASANAKRKRVVNKMSDNSGCLNNFENCKRMNHESDYLNVNDQVGSNEEATMCKLLDGKTTLGSCDGTHSALPHREHAAAHTLGWPKHGI